MDEQKDQTEVRYGKARVLKRLRDRRLARAAYRPEKGAQRLLNGLILIATLVLGGILIFMLVLLLG